jgi:hypothetical protein
LKNLSLGGGGGAGFVTPTKAILADAERTMLLLSPLEGAPGGRSDRVYQMDLETEKIVREW